jgi:hypothetical protein
MIPPGTRRGELEPAQARPVPSRVTRSPIRERSSRSPALAIEPEQGKEKRGGRPMWEWERSSRRANVQTVLRIDIGRRGQGLESAAESGSLG